MLRTFGLTVYSVADDTKVNTAGNNGVIIDNIYNWFELQQEIKEVNTNLFSL